MWSSSEPPSVPSFASNYAKASSDKKAMDGQAFQFKKKPPPRRLNLSVIGLWIFQHWTKLQNRKTSFPKKSSLQKIFGLNLSLHARIADGNPILSYAAPASARIFAPENKAPRSIVARYLRNSPKPSTLLRQATSDRLRFDTNFPVFNKPSFVIWRKPAEAHLRIKLRRADFACQLTF